MVAKKFNPKSRVFLNKAACHSYFESVQKNLHVSQTKLAHILGISPRTFTAWKAGANSFPMHAAHLLKIKTGIPLPRGAKIEQNPFWYTHKGASLGARRVHELYGNNFSNTPYRRAQWLKWWKEKGQHISHIGKRKTVTLPPYSEDLAEFVGIMLGDGSVTKYQIKITLNKINDKRYSFFVIKLIKKLFGVVPTCVLSKKNNALNISVSRRDLVVFCTEKLGLPVGNKIQHRINIPRWILTNKIFLARCIRGLVDTDGSVFWERHKGSTLYAYPRLNFTSASPPLVQSVFIALTNIGLSPVIRRGGRSVQVEKKKEIWDYWHTVGSSNPKHQRKMRRIGRDV